MNYLKRIAYIVSLISIVSLVMVINGCGSNKESTREGCPNGSFLANFDDKISGPIDATVSISYPSAAGSVLFSPAVFTVTDSKGVPRNKICLILYTDGIWYTDSTYMTPIVGTGPMNAVAVVTDDLGNAVQYWSTEVLPAANLAALASGTLTAGADQVGESWIQAYSGVLSETYNVKWTVAGQPAQ